MCQRVIVVYEGFKEFFTNCGDIIVATQVATNSIKSLIIDFKHGKVKAVRNGVMVELKLNPHWLLQELDRHYFDEFVDEIVDSTLPLLN